MTVLLFALAFLVGAFVLLATIYVSLSKARTQLPTYQKRPLLTPSEKQFFRLLQRAVGAQSIVSVQVAMGALLDPTAESIDAVEAKNRAHARNRLRSVYSRKYVDFVLLDPASLEAHTVVELDDASHDRKGAEDMERDRWLQSAGYRVCRFDVRKKPTVEDIRAKLSDNPAKTTEATAEVIPR